MSNSLSPKQIDQLVSQGCTCEDWSLIDVSEDFEVSQVNNCNLIGKISLGNLGGSVTDTHGIEKPCGIYKAVIINCTIGNNVRIANVGVHIANYDIGNDVCIENIGVMQTNPNAVFSNGVKVEVLNEAGGREVIIFDELNAQFAYLMCVHRYRK